MKKLFLYTLSALLSIPFFSGCKEDVGSLTPVSLQNLYVITPGVTDADSVQQKRYEIYKTYNVPVFFNDTIGKTFVQKSASGDSIFAYETLDPAWYFIGYSNNFAYRYQTDAAQQMASLRFVEIYLSKASKPMRPFSILLTDSLITNAQVAAKRYQYANEDSTYVFDQTMRFYTGARVLIFSGVAKLAAEPRFADVAANEVIRTMIGQRVPNYTTKLSEFFIVSDKNFYDKSWSVLIPGIKHELAAMQHYAFSCDLLSDISYNSYLKLYPETYTPDMLDKERLYIRGVIGKFGFVASNPGLGIFSPSSPTKDLEFFVDEMLRHPKAEFEELWGASPLVMKKYKIIYDVIEKELQYKL